MVKKIFKSLCYSAKVKNKTLQFACCMYTMLLLKQQEVTLKKVKWVLNTQ